MAEFLALLGRGEVALDRVAEEGGDRGAGPRTTIGEGALFNAARFTMGFPDLQSGIGFITLAMAMFALPEAIFLVMNAARSRKSQSAGEIGKLRITGEDAATPR